MVKNRLINFGLLAGVLVLCLICLEVAIRLFFPSPRHQVFFDETVGYRREPNSVIGSNSVNSLGFLDDEHSYEKDEGAYRIVFLGDSVVEATGVQRQDSFTKVLETKLNEISEKRIEVINLGVSGFGTANEYLTLKKYGLKFSPDLTILAFTVGNDFGNNYYKTNSSLDPTFDVAEGKLIQTKTPTPLEGGKLRDWFSNNLQFPRFMIRQLSKIASLRNLLMKANLITTVKDLPEGEGVPFDFYFYTTSPNQDKEAAFEVTEVLISEIAKTAKDNDSDFLTVLFPSQLQHNSKDKASLLAKYPVLLDLGLDFTLPQKTLEDYLGENNISYLDLFPVLQGTEDTLYKPPEEGGHYNKDGHLVVAQAIFDYLQEKNLIK